MSEYREPSASAADLKQKIGDDINRASDFVRNQASAASAKAEEAADDQKNFIATKLGGVAAAMEKVGAELEGGNDRDLGRMTARLGETMRNASEGIQNKSLGEIAGMAEDFGRKQPLAFLSIAAIAGLAASRFITSSADQNGASVRTDRSAPPTTSQPAPATGASSGEERSNG